MATSSQDQATYEISQILNGDEEARKRFERQAGLATFGFWGPDFLGPWKISPSRDLTCVQLYGQFMFLQILKVVMLKEAIGLGPQKYCVALYRAPYFYSRLKLLLIYLPFEKMFLYPTQ